MTNKNFKLTGSQGAICKQVPFVMAGSQGLYMEPRKPSPLPDIRTEAGSCGRAPTTPAPQTLTRCFSYGSSYPSRQPLGHPSLSCWLLGSGPDKNPVGKEGRTCD